MTHPPYSGRIPSRLLPFCTLLLGGTLVAGCSDTSEPIAPSPTPDATATVLAAAGELGDLTVEARSDLAMLRRVVAPFHDLAHAEAAGWDTPITPCLESPAGGMGYHYANLALFDGSVSADAPEALLYEPQKNGQLRFVGVEYIVPLELAEDPPSLFGMEFHRNEAVGIWALHAWVGLHNPAGMFADWNPNVSCEHAPDEE